VSIFDLLHAPSSYGKLSRRGFVGFLDELVQNHNLSPNHRTEEYPSDSFRGPETQLKQSITHRASVRHTQVRAVYLHPIRISEVAGKETSR
jgi:hypothetical protein